jgi:antitoxin MazE
MAKKKSRQMADDIMAGVAEIQAMIRDEAEPQERFTVRGKLVRMGNWRGVRLPKTVIEQAGLTTDVEIAVRDGQIIIRSADEDVPRAGWEGQIKKVLSEHPEDVDVEWLEAPLASTFEEKEWTW